MSRMPVWVVGALAFTVLALLCIGTGAPEIQAKVLACTQTGLAEAGMAGVVAQIDGRDVVLAGPGADASLEDRARDIARACGARRVEGDWSGGPTGPYTTLLCLAQGRLGLSGSVPDPSVEAGLAASLRERTGVTSIEGDLRLRNGAPEGYTRMVERAGAELPQLDDGCIEMEDREVRVSGAIRSQAALDRMVESLESAAGGDFRLSVDVEVPDLTEGARACQAAYNEMLGPGARVLFDFDSSELHREGRALLDTVEGIWAERCPEVAILVTGHTDNIGDPGYNRTLSQERAQAVVDYLVEQGFDPEKLTPVGYGETQPRATNGTEEGRTQNRRIEFRVRESER